MHSIDDSLKRLGTDYVDLYQIHRWDYDTPIEAYLEDTGLLDQIPENLRYYFDIKAFARDLVLGGDITELEINGRTYTVQAY